MTSIRQTVDHLFQANPSEPADWGDFARTTPFSRHFGYDRGDPIDRVFIADFLQQHTADIHGRTLEIGDDSYTRHFGESRVTQADVLHVAPGNPAATLLGDLAQASHLPDNTFDCFILTQTLHLIFDVAAGIATVHRILKPGGVVLATVPAISQPSADQWAANWYWSFSSGQMRQLFSDVFGAKQVATTSYGNRHTTTAFLYGLASQELPADWLTTHDPAHEMLVGIRAVKAETNE